MQFLKIVGVVTGATILYGIVHDQITARICIEYFTVGHVWPFATKDPTLIGLFFGVTATWWVGLFLGLMLALTARVGSLPKRDTRSLVYPFAMLVLSVSVLAPLMGVIGFCLAQAGQVTLLEPLAQGVPAERHSIFLADLWAHSASYGFGAIGGLGVCGMVYIQRCCAGLALQRERLRKT
jgi:hypothetical protein